MARRKALPKKIRFEVFKRDHFTCRYCGRMAPDVILEVDHIHPVAEGGTDDMVNLITSCRDCNRGKGKRKLTDNDELKKQQAALEELAERREQAEMMAEWRQALADTENDIAKNASDYIHKLSGYSLTENGMRTIKKLIKQFSFQEVMDAIEISFNHYYNGTEKSWDKAFDKLGGICYNRRKAANAGWQTITIRLADKTVEQIKKEMEECEVAEEYSVSEYLSECLDLKYWVIAKEGEKNGEV